MIDRTEHPATIYVREDSVVPGLDAWIAELFEPDNLDHTCAALADATEPDPEEQARREEIRRRIAELDKELHGYRTVMRNEPDAAETVG